LFAKKEHRQEEKGRNPLSAEPAA